MGIEDGLVARLETATGLAALIGSGNAMRVYPNVLPQSVKFPAVRYQVVSVARPHLMGKDAGIASARVQVDSYATGYSDAKRVATEVRVSLSRFRGTSTGEVFQGVTLDTERDLYEDQTKLHRVEQEYIAHHEE